MKNIVKKVATVIIALAVLVTAVNPARIEAAAKKASLNKKAVTLTITNKNANPSVTLKVKNTKKSVKWTVNNKKIATVKKTGKYSAKITAKKAGKETITCKVNGRTLKCKVTVVDKRTADNEASLDKKAVTLTITDGDEEPSVALKVENAKKAVDWKTSNKDVITVTARTNNSVWITAVGAGKAVVACKVNGKTLECEVTVIDNTKDDEDDSEVHIAPNGKVAIGYWVCGTRNSKGEICGYKMDITEFDGSAEEREAFDKHLDEHIAKGECVQYTGFNY